MCDGYYFLQIKKRAVEQCMSVLSVIIILGNKFIKLWQVLLFRITQSPPKWPAKGTNFVYSHLRLFRQRNSRSEETNPCHN